MEAAPSGRPPILKYLAGLVAYCCIAIVTGLTPGVPPVYVTVTPVPVASQVTALTGAGAATVVVNVPEATVTTPAAKVHVEIALAGFVTCIAAAAVAT